MTRFALACTTTTLACILAAALPGGMASAQPGHGKKGGAAPHAAPARPAPPPRPAAAPRPTPAMRAPSMAVRPAAPAVRQMQAPRQFARPPRVAPHIAAPIRRAAPIQRSAPASRAVQRLERMQRRHVQNPSPRLRASERLQQRHQAAEGRRLQQLQSRRGRLSRVERRELRRLQRQQATPRQVQFDQRRLQQLQQRSERHRLSRTQRRELRQLQRAQRDQQRLNPQTAVQRARPRHGRVAKIDPQQVRQGRFASNFYATARGRGHGERRAARMAAHAAWRLGLAAGFVPWRGPLYWPYAYNDIFYYTFWPDAYEPGYWAYAYDDFFDGIFFPYGAPYIETEYAGPYGVASETTGSVARRAIPGRITRTDGTFCADQASGATAWPFERIEKAVQPNDEQQGLLQNLRRAAADAARDFKEACPDAVPMTPPGRLAAMIVRLEATLAAVKTVRPALTAFYESLSDEQKARFNELGPDIGRQAQHKPETGDCGGDKAGLGGLVAERIETVVQPTKAQDAAFDRLDNALQKAVDGLRDACPLVTPLTPVGRLEAMQKRLEAMIAAANTVRPALADFYAALSDEQKATFNRLGRETSRSSE